MDRMEVEKYHGLGNDYLIFDPEKNKCALNRERVRLLCNRNLGPGADGVLEGPLSGPEEVRIWNSDGSLAGKSENGIRIFAYDQKRTGKTDGESIHIRTKQGPVQIDFMGAEYLRSLAGPLTFYSDRIPVSGPRREVVEELMLFREIPYRVTCVSDGNPHCVILLNEISREIVTRIGRGAEESDYFPERVNLTVMNVIDRKHIQIETYERGSGYTLASGSAGCAAAGVAQRMGLADSCLQVEMAGGTMLVEQLEHQTLCVTSPVRHVAKMVLGKALSQEIRRLKESDSSQFLDGMGNISYYV